MIVARFKHSVRLELDRGWLTSMREVWWSPGGIDLSVARGLLRMAKRITTTTADGRTFVKEKRS